ncbi:hypothetical protein [Pelagicoccus mobilis]|uniref:Agarase CBM-like domain-containing protein n=1 Tax=Pelagicoccus mobilis TaxID=415221 RepID=A0A934S0E5_9BACT|nr:hypothetical protein [Pelagicoccus mobilis]MBK1880067.1 hypothetical protein [Pelagicoccus mobilis]
MNLRKFNYAVLGGSVLLGIVSSANASGLVELSSFEGREGEPVFRAIDADARVVSGKGVTDGKKALRVDFKADKKTSVVEFKTDEVWNCKGLGAYHMQFEATNPGDRSINLQVSLRAGSGAGWNRAVSIPAKSSGSYYFELVGEGVSEDFGMRDDPPTMNIDATKMVSMGFKRKGDFTSVKQVRFFVRNNLFDKSLILDNIRFVSSPERDPNALLGFVDAFGQNASVDFEHKVQSEEHMKELADAELRALAVSAPMKDRSIWGGWKEGPKLEGTGFFRTEKVGGKWAIVDPEGYLFFSSGIANVRMANTSTFTGVDYRDDSVRYIDPEDVTPEDSQGIVAVPREIKEDDFVSNEMRRNLFTWLPDYDDKLAKHYSYRRKTHHGPVPHGQTFSFYQANLERRYGETYPNSFIAKWRDVTLDRMLDWGFTSFGNWAAAEFYHSKRFPYFANGWIIGEYATLSSGNDYWGAMPDPFDPEFARRARVTTETIAEEVLGSPWCIGVFIDNEMSWGNENSVRSRYALALDAISKAEAESPAKAAFMKTLKKKHRGIAKLNKAWGTEIASWGELAKGVPFQDSQLSDGMVEDLSVLMESYARQYFEVVSGALKDVLPNHMYLGPRLTTWGMTREVRKAAVDYVDVMGVNYYREDVGTADWGFLEEIDMPCLIGEFHMGSSDTGCPHPGIIHASDVKDRARMWTDYMKSVIDNPYLVGAHWFQYIDSPITGRAHDGENYNVGFVTQADVPYPNLVAAARKLHAELYQRKYGELKED